MNKLFKVGSTLLVAALMSTSAIAQAEEEKKAEGYVFTDTFELANTSVKDQHRSGTCWSFSSLSFIESEMMRMGKPEADLSEMFVVWNTYSQKARRYVRMHGNLNFGGGGAFHDAVWVIDNYGMVPEDAFTGLTIGEEKHVHGEMDNILKKYVDGVIANKNRTLTPVWGKGFDALLDVYLGETPETFEVDGKTYTPRSYADDYMGINADDYVEIGSYTHHPFYEPFILEVPDNWLWGQVYNVPVQEMTEVIDHALKSGYTVAWATDVSDKGFASKTKGLAVVPAENVKEMSDSEISKWEDMTESQKMNKLYSFEKPGAEKVITQSMRQVDFDNYQTTDDHGMHIVGMATDQNGTEYYKVKNSWDDYNEFGGYLYVSKAFVQLRTTNFMVHKDGIPKSIRKKLDL